MMADDHKAVIAALAAVVDAGESAALATVISTDGSLPRHAGSKMLVYPDGRIVGTVGGGAMEAKVIESALQALRDGEASLQTYTLNNLTDGDPGICGGTAQIFIEPVLGAPHLLVIGAGHVGVALAQLGKWAGYYVTLCDDRAEFCNPEHAPDCDEYVVCPPSQVADYAKISARTSVAAVTRGLPVDIDLIPALLATDAAYIGLIGSRRRWALTVRDLVAERGLTVDDLERIRAPIGLEIEAETPKEIAVSILAEIIMVRRGGTGQPMRYKPEEMRQKSAK